MKPLLLLGACAVVAWLPFLATYVPPTSGAAPQLPALIARLPVLSSLVSAVALYRGERTSLLEYLTIFGVPYVFGIALVVFGMARDVNSRNGSLNPRSVNAWNGGVIQTGVIPSTGGVMLRNEASRLAEHSSGVMPRVIPRNEGSRQTEQASTVAARNEESLWHHTATPRPLQTLLIASVITIIPGVLLSAPVIPLCGIPLALAISQLRAAIEVSPRWFALLLFSFGWALSIAVELIYVRDVFDNRMNTLFKFYYQTWTLFALATAVTVVVLWKATSGIAWRRALLSAAIVTALLAGAVYPTIASYQWTDHFAAWQGLDGLAYGAETDPDDTAAIRWLAQHAAPGDVVLEAAGCSYLPFDHLPFNRVSAFTGIPTVIGWGNNHQRQWRAGQPDLIAEIGRRDAAVAAMYSHPDSPLFAKYGVTWLFVGEYESGDWRADCPTAGPYDLASLLDPSDSAWVEAFRSGDTRIYRRDDG